MTWYCKKLSQSEEFSITSKIQDAFPLAFANSQSPSMAVFITKSAGKDRIVYFSPDAKFLAGLFSAEPSEKPQKDSLALLVGDERGCWSMNFPNS